jgi:sigma-B regulation protein RsbU (phosphoserine phosphatase)
MCVLRHEKPALVLPELNRLLCAGNDEFMFVTLAVVLLDTGTGKLIYLNGGHNPPLLSTRGQPFRQFNPAAGILLGVEPKAEFRPEELQLHPGDTLLLYTDGVPEAENSAKEGFTMERTAAALNRTGPSGGVVRLVDDLVADVAKFAGDAPQSDDITVLGLRYCGL